MTTGQRLAQHPCVLGGDKTNYSCCALSSLKSACCPLLQETYDGHLTELHMCCIKYESVQVLTMPLLMENPQCITTNTPIVFYQSPLTGGTTLKTYSSYPPQSNLTTWSPRVSM